MRLSEVAKQASADLSESEQQALIRRKKVNRRLAQVGGVTGVAALALRGPQFARAGLSRSKALSQSPSLKTLASYEPKATKLSDSVGTVAIGSGAVNSFNWAKIQQLETKREQGHAVKGAPLREVGKAEEKSHASGRDAARVKVESRQFKKSDDKFLRNYRNRISPKAELGYEYLRSGRNGYYRDAAGNAAVTGALVGGVAMARRLGSPVMLGATAGAAGYTGYSSLKDLRAARRWEGRMALIRRRAKIRESKGEFGAGREPVGKSFGLIGPRRIAGVRRGGLVRLSSGRQVTRRGSIAGTGAYR